MNDRAGGRLPTRLPPELAEALARIDERQRQMQEQFGDVLEQLKRGNERFVQIALSDQELRAGLAGLRQDFSRAMLTADRAKSDAGAVQAELATFKTQIRVLAFIFGPVVGIVIVLVSEVLKRAIWP
jgi:chromosome segregation ATPase